jgi:hypothetical protein
MSWKGKDATSANGRIKVYAPIVSKEGRHRIAGGGWRLSYNSFEKREGDTSKVYCLRKHLTLPYGGSSDVETAIKSLQGMGLTLNDKAKHDYAKFGKSISFNTYRVRVTYQRIHPLTQGRGDQELSVEGPLPTLSATGETVLVEVSTEVMSPTVVDEALLKLKEWCSFMAPLFVEASD